MTKQIKPLSSPSISSYLFAGTFGVAGLGVIGWGLKQLVAGAEQGMAEFGLALVLGGGFLALSIFLIRSFRADRNKFAWLNQNGVWITAKPVKTKTLTSDDFNKVTSYCLILQAVAQNTPVNGLADLEFESEPIIMPVLPQNYQDKEFDVVIDPVAPAERYHVNVDVQKLFA